MQKRYLSYAPRGIGISPVGVKAGETGPTFYDYGKPVDTKGLQEDKPLMRLKPQ